MIPKVIHITWKDKNILNNTSPLLDMGIKNLVKLSPDWKIEISDDSDIDEYLKNNLDTIDFCAIANKPIVEKIDLWRLIKLYLEGGIYLDIDRLCNKPLDFITDDIKMILPTCLDYDFSHDFMGSARHNPIFLKAIQLNLERRLSGVDSIYALGPQTYMNAITFYILGFSLNPNPGIGMFANIRNIIRKYSFILSYRENPPYDTILFKADKNFSIDHEYEKRAFYKQQNIKHWTGEW